MKIGWRDIVARCLLVAMLMTGAFGFKIPEALAFTDGQDATEVLGQTDGDFPDPGPNFTKDLEQDDQDGGNGYGYNDVFDTAFDGVHHRLFVSDQQNARVLVYDLNTDDTLPDSSPDKVLGQPDFVTTNGDTTDSTFASPYGLGYDGVHDLLYVGDRFNHRVMIFDTASITNGEAAVHVLGQDDFDTSDSHSAPPTQDGMFQPTDIAIDTTGNRAFISDSNNSRVLVFDVSSITDGENAANVIGQATFSTNDQATDDSGFEYPQGLAYDPTGNLLYVSDSYNYRVMVFDVASVTNGEAAVKVIGQDDFDSNDYDVSATRLGNPFGVAFDDGGDRLYVTDNDSGRVLVFDVASISNGEAAVNVLGVADFDDFGGSDGAASLDTPNGLSYGNGFLFVADEGNARVMVWNVASITNGEDAVDLLGQTMYSYQSFDPADPGYGFFQPAGTALDEVHHRFFAVDRQNNRVVVYDLNTDNTFVDRRQDHVLGQPSLRHSAQGTTQSSLKQPEGVAYDAAGDRLFVADTANNRVMVFDVASIADGENAANVLGQSLFTTSSATTTQSGLSAPTNLSYVPASGQLLVEDTGNNRVLVFDVASITNGENATGLIGQADFTRGDADGGTNAGGFNTPYDVEVDAVHHRLFVADTNNNRVLEYDLDVNDDLIDKIPDHVLGEPNFTTDEGGFQTFASAGYLDGPSGVAYDSAGDRLFVGDSGNNRILVFDVASITDGENAVKVLAQPDFTTVTFSNLSQSRHYNTGAVTFDANHNYLYANDFGNSRVMVYDVASITNGENAVNVLGQPNFTTADWGTPSQANLSFPNSTAFDATHNKLYVSDTGYHRVMVFDVASITDGENAVSVLGQSNFTSQTFISPPTQASVATPAGITVDGAGNRLFVGDLGGVRVMVFDVASITDGENAVNVIGAYDFTSFGTGDLSSSRIGAPGDLWYASSNGLLYVADQTYNRVLIYDVSSITDGEAAADLMGQDDYSSIGTNGSANANGLEAPAASVVDPIHHRLFVADSANSRVLMYGLDGSDVLSDSVPDAILGHASFGSTAFNPGQDGFQGYPSGLAYDGMNDMLMVGDVDGNRVLIFDVASITNGENAVNVLGQPDFDTFAANTTISGFSEPRALTYDEDNEALYVTDENNNRLMVFGGASMGGGGGGGGGSNDPTLDNAISMTRLKAGTSSTVSISFELQNTLDGTWTATFPVGFTVTGAMTQGTCSGGGTVDTFAFSGGSRTMTAEKHGCSGTLSLSGGTVTNPNTPGLYFVTWTNDDPGEGGVAIVDDDQVTVTAQVNASITFDIDTATTDTESSAPYSVALGNVTTSDTRVSGSTDGINSIWLDLSTNAGAGAVVAVKNANGASGLVSTSVPGDTIDSANGTMADGTENYGICSVSESDVSGNLDDLSPYDGTCAADSETNVVGALSTTPTPIYDTDGAPIQGGRAQIAVNAAISTSTVAHNDYTDTLIFIATGTF